MEIFQYGNPTTTPLSMRSSAQSTVGPWAFVVSSKKAIKVLSGRVVISDNLEPIPIENLGGELEIDANQYVYLSIKLSQGNIGKVELIVGDDVPSYRVFDGSGKKSIATQTELNIVIYYIGWAVGSTTDSSTGISVFKCSHTDIAIYANCDGLVAMQAPYSLP